jgi:hypothetical protein
MIYVSGRMLLPQAEIAAESARSSQPTARSELTSRRQ